MQAEREILSVSSLNRAVKRVLEMQFGMVWVEGEISNLARPASGHIYFSLKDDKAQVRCAMFRARNTLLGFTPDDGNQVIVRARVGMFEPRGEYQLIVEHMEPAGEGLLRLKFEQLKRKLAAEGLFDQDTKREIVKYPQTIGVITSPTGAAIRDIVTVLARRNPTVDVIIYPTAVQGESAAPAICAALRSANRRAECDTLIVARGGGSLEDLWAFNEEPVVRAIFDSEIPVVTGIGHEIDFTLADFAADVRAPTPSASAELVAPTVGEMAAELRQWELRLSELLRAELIEKVQLLDRLSSRLEHPGQRIRQFRERTRELANRLPQALAVSLNLKRAACDALTTRVYAQSPGERIQGCRWKLVETERRLQTAVRAVLNEREAALRHALRTLTAVSPQGTLNRGYAIVMDRAGAIVRDASRYAIGDMMTARLKHGELKVSVDEIIADKSPSADPDQNS